MRYLALACDYDGTLATEGAVDEATLKALEAVLASGRTLLLVTGRELPDLQENFAHLNLFARVVAENGALLYNPATKEEKPLAVAPPARFIEELKNRHVEPLAVGRVIVATWQPHQSTVLDVIRQLGLELQVIFNKAAVMVLPSGVNKATGLNAALAELGFSPHNVVGVGDAENDHAFLTLCECSAAVANALPMLKETADMTTKGARGVGVAELITELIADDLVHRDDKLSRHHLLLGNRLDDNAEVRLRPFGVNVLLAGPSGSGKSTVATGILERLAEHNYQYLIIDPEGDYDCFEGAVVLGNSQRGPTAEEVIQFLTESSANAVVNLVGMPITERPGFFLTLLPRLQERRVRTGRPHWLIIDEAHHLMPASWQPAAQALPHGLDCTVLITVHPDQLPGDVVNRVTTVIAVGRGPTDTLGQFCQVINQQPPEASNHALEPGEVLLWERQQNDKPVRVRFVPNKQERRRHSRKYAEGELPPNRSFYFQGPDGKLNLRAQNILLFLQIAEGVDDATWEFHRRRGDYSLWFRDKIKDSSVAETIAGVEEAAELPPKESRQRIRTAIEQRYTVPEAAPLPMPNTNAESARK